MCCSAVICDETTTVKKSSFRQECSPDTNDRFLFDLPNVIKIDLSGIWRRASSSLEVCWTLRRLLAALGVKWAALSLRKCMMSWTASSMTQNPSSEHQRIHSISSYPKFVLGILWTGSSSTGGLCLQLPCHQWRCHHNPHIWLLASHRSHSRAATNPALSPAVCQSIVFFNVTVCVGSDAGSVWTEKTASIKLSSRRPRRPLCQICKKTGKFISCNECQESFHIACISFKRSFTGHQALLIHQLTFFHLGKWTCDTCRNARQSVI